MLWSHIIDTTLGINSYITVTDFDNLFTDPLRMYIIIQIQV